MRRASRAIGDPGSVVVASRNWRRASFTSPDQSSSSPRWKRTVAARGNRRESGPSRENASDGLALSKRPTAEATSASGSAGARLAVSSKTRRAETG